MNPLFKFLKINNIYSLFDQKVADLGWVAGCDWLIKNLKINYFLKSDKGKIPSKGPILLYANHPTGLDPYLLTAALKRNDSYFWGDIYQTKKGNYISKHIIPIAPKPFFSIIRRPITNWPGYIYMRLTTPAFSKEKTKMINRESMKKTVDLLKYGKQVIIFPSGGEYEFLGYKKGLTKILRECQRLKIPVVVKMVKIKKFGELALLLHFLFKVKVKALIEII